VLVAVGVRVAAGVRVLAVGAELAEAALGEGEPAALDDVDPEGVLALAEPEVLDPGAGAPAPSGVPGFAEGLPAALGELEGGTAAGSEPAAEPQAASRPAASRAASGPTDRRGRVRPRLGRGVVVERLIDVLR
jgi:hypothetical protein